MDSHFIYSGEEELIKIKEINDDIIEITEIEIY